jgi:hypothetical protein
VEGNNVYQLGELTRIVRRLEKDMYHGNGNPGITVRMASVEDIVHRTNKNLSRIVWLLLSTVLAVIVDIVMQNIKK